MEDVKALSVLLISPHIKLKPLTTVKAKQKLKEITSTQLESFKFGFKSFILNLPLIVSSCIIFYELFLVFFKYIFCAKLTRGKTVSKLKLKIIECFSFKCTKKKGKSKEMKWTLKVLKNFLNELKNVTCKKKKKYERIETKRVEKFEEKNQIATDFQKLLYYGLKEGTSQLGLTA